MRGIRISKDRPIRFPLTISKIKLKEIKDYCKGKMSMADFFRQSADEKMRNLGLSNNQPSIKKIFLKIEKDKEGIWICFYHIDENGVTNPTYSMSPTFFDDFIDDCRKIRSKLIKVKGKNSNPMRLK